MFYIAVWVKLDEIDVFLCRCTHSPSWQVQTNHLSCHIALLPINVASSPESRVWVSLFRVLIAKSSNRSKTLIHPVLVKQT